jgi:EAL domain-containing protein (putative c-di-GMP-specific phosphodiesterase class I)
VYAAKDNGRNQVRAFVGELSDRAEQRLKLSGQLSDALEGDQLHVVYQPVVSLGSDALLGVEALVRWDHPDRGPVPPSVFVPVAEKTGLARALDGWVLRRSCAEFAALRARGTVPHTSYLAVNVTAGNVVDPAFPSTVGAALAASGLPATSLVLEVTETGVMNDLDTGVRMLTALTDLGVRVAIDDFGTGWSSLTYVKRLPARFIKLDRSFVARLDEDAEDLAIAASVIRLGEATGMTVIAEGVETPSQLAVLRRLRCPAGQGYLWSAAVPAAELPQALARVSTVQQARPDTPALPKVPAAPGPEHGLALLWQLHGEGASMMTVAAALNRDGYRNVDGKRWHHKAVAATLGRAALVASEEHTLRPSEQPRSPAGAAARRDTLS